MRRDLLLLLALVAGCTPTNPAPEAVRPPPIDAEPPLLEVAPSATVASTAPPKVVPPDASARDASTPDSTPEASLALPKVVTIGMHVGGGPYDEITKEPMKRSVEPRFAELARCWKHVASAPRPADMGVDLVIEAAGGRARVSNPRTQIQGEGFVPCVLAFFESVEFQKPRNGKTVVSYSVRFTP